MAVSTTQSIWRSGGGDQTRAAYCGSGVMAATFYIPAAGTAGNVQASATNTARVVLPAGAVPLNIIINDTGTGQIDLGFTDGTTPSANGLLNDAAVTAITSIAAGDTGSGASLGTVLSATKNVTITNAVGGTPGTGTVGGVIVYYVTDPYAGQQNV